ncbi:protein of unknown function [Cupriavidus neocaledonicus]|uniref:Uncharacterized protein n=1 Tax=Cupriavidus neocaledonicus TaxID=1040979 RepID=A0A375H4T7_9BURK|nr:protein of unknown function [Cupriavidus neocaledonicus]
MVRHAGKVLYRTPVALQRRLQARIIACIAELTDNLRGDAALTGLPEIPLKRRRHEPNRLARNSQPGE